MESEIIVLHTEYTKIAYIIYVDSSLIFQLLLAFVVLLGIMSTVFCVGHWIFFVGNQRRHRIYLLFYLPAPKSVSHIKDPIFGIKSQDHVIIRKFRD
jgi:hypothetical protein